MFSQDLLKTMLSWPKANKIPICIGCDVGGSGIRVRISSFLDKSKILDLPHAKAQSTKDLLNIIEELRKSLDTAIPFECKGASIAVAGPITNDTVVFTNWPGHPSERTLKLTHLPSEIFPPNRSAFLNDLEAGAYGVIAANEAKILEDHFEQMWPEKAPTGPLVSQNRTAVLALGSGLGVGLIINTPLLGKPFVLPTELGHLQIPIVGHNHPDRKYEKQLFKYISDHYYNGTDTIEYEDIASGRGLALSYQYIFKRDTGKTLPLESLNGGDIAALAQKGDAQAKEAMSVQTQILLRCAKAVATSLSCDSVLLALDNQVKNNYLMHEYKDKLCKEFYQFIRPDWMKNIRVYTQTKILNFNLMGTDYMAHALAEK
ncbi:Glucokinase 1 [Histomonas meleagridis]|uniref:Glucokinase 1 n=1 Tax=Histomonas meleagridis TaxID=135588 RepID=UPI00355A3436|nr:Glucokinase 1 [Histomonas meleagridis]KAH0798601.1 Glucokinase 1 [Histomonas meleagridis]